MSPDPSAAARDLAWFRDPGAAHQRRRFVELLRLLSYQERPVVLASGQTSDFYIDCKQAVLTAEGHFLAGHLVLHVLAQAAPEIEALGGLSVGADPIASAASTLSYLGGRPLQAFYVRKEPKGHGTQAWLEGPARPGAPVAIVEDVVTTGASTLRAVERAQAHGLLVRHVVALCDREEGGREAIEAIVPMTALTRRTEIVS